LVAALALSLRAQTQAKCTFNIFQLNDLQTTVFGVNDYGTVVGEADFTSSPQKGFIRYSGSGVSYFSAPSSAATRLTGRNDAGTSVGVYSSLNANTIAKGFMLSGSAFTSIVHPNAVLGTSLTGINKYHSIVGWYYDASENQHGFKRYSNGGYAALNYPASGASPTIPQGINDGGAIVGSYGNQHGFIFHNGTWATLDYPNSSRTELLGISNAGVIVGLNHATQQGISFMYVNGAFKTINIPNSFLTNVSAIAPGGLLAGTANMTGDQSGWRGFTATCK
jgi:hypothetical protein